MTVCIRMGTTMYDVLRQLNFVSSNYVHKECPTPLCMLFKDNHAILFPARS